MRFQVPQFIEKESKLIGPFTLKQFLWYAAAGVIILIVQFFTVGTTLIVIGVILLGLATAMAYAKIDEVPLPKYILLGFIYAMGLKKYTFIKEDNNKLPISNIK